MLKSGTEVNAAAALPAICMSSVHVQRTRSARGTEGEKAVYAGLWGKSACGMILRRSPGWCGVGFACAKVLCA